MVAETLSSAQDIQMNKGVSFQRNCGVTSMWRRKRNFRFINRNSKDNVSSASLHQSDNLKVLCNHLIGLSVKNLTQRIILTDEAF